MNSIGVAVVDGVLVDVDEAVGSTGVLLEVLVDVVVVVGVVVAVPLTHSFSSTDT